MNDKVSNFIRNFSYTLSSNLISFLISTLVVLIIPRLIGIKEYGYWQLYLFYVSYIGFLHFGWNDGIYLKYGGEKYEDLNKKLLFSQFYMLLISQVIIASIIIFIAKIQIHNENRLFIFQMISICLVLTNVRLMLLFILQASYRIKEYANITIVGRLIYFGLIIVFLLTGVREYKLMIVADLLGRFVSLLIAIYYCNDIVIRKLSSFYFSFNEAFESISIGIKLMFANIASILIIGIVRFGIERTWDVETFGKVSLTLSASNMMMLFINAVGVIMFPILRRTNEKRLPEIYNVVRDFLMVVLLGLLIGYYPIKTILSSWLPKYSDSLMYMALVFPMFIYEGKMALLINTYLKTLRKEKMILKINLISVSLSLTLAILTTVILKNLDLAILSIVILLAVRSIIAEVFLSKLLKINSVKNITLELLLTIMFILSGWYIDSWNTVLIYSVGYVGYLFIKHKDIKQTINSLKLLSKA